MCYKCKFIFSIYQSRQIILTHFTHRLSSDSSEPHPTHQVLSQLASHTLHIFYRFFHYSIYLISFEFFISYDLESEGDRFFAVWELVSSVYIKHFYIFHFLDLEYCIRYGPISLRLVYDEVDVSRKDLILECLI